MYYEDSLDSAPLDAPPAQGGKPQVPAKFLDPRTGEVRVDALVQAYTDLERRMHGGERLPNPDYPDSPDGYQIQTSSDFLCSDPDVNRRLHEAGFTCAQAQLVYDLAHDRVLPMIHQVMGDHEQRRHLDRLKDYFGGESRWSETARQISAWGKANLSPQVYQALSTSADGIMAMQKMMGSEEPGMGRAPVVRDEAPSESDLKKMMQDPRYWKKRDPAFIDKVSAGFRRLGGDTP